MTLESKLKKAHQDYDDAVACAIREEVDRLIETGLTPKEAGMLTLRKTAEVARELQGA
jgi:hypothetical protein